MKKNIEQIEINENYVYPPRSKESLPKDKLYIEKTNIQKREIVLNKKLSYEEQKKELEKFVSNLFKKISKMDIDYAFLRLFKYVVKEERKEEYKKATDDFEKFLKTFKMSVEKINIKMKTNIGISSPKEVNDLLDSLYEEILGLYNYASGLNEDLENIRNNYYHEFKFSSYSIIHNKSLDEINDLITRVDEELKNYRNVNNASDYIVYNSGIEIQDTVDEFCKLDKKYTYINYHYFLNQDAIIAFKFQEWVELFMKFNYVLGKVDNKDVTPNLMKKYRDMETKYAILLINGEM